MPGIKLLLTFYEQGCLHFVLLVPHACCIRSCLDFKFKQEAELSQRGRAMLLVIEYFANLLKVDRNDTLEFAFV